MASEEQKAAIKKTFDYLNSLSAEELRASVEACSNDPLALTFKELFEECMEIPKFERILTQEDWWKLGEDRFRIPPRMWRFKCPCGHSQCGQDLINAGMGTERAMDLVYRKCQACGSSPEIGKLAVIIDNAIVPAFAYDSYTPEDQLKILDEFSHKLLDNQEPCPPEFMKVLNDNLEDILA